MGKGSWSRRRHMKEVMSSTEAGRRVVRQLSMQSSKGRSGNVLIQGVHIHGGEKHVVVHISWGRKTHLMQDVCPELVANVVADADDMLSGEDHVESRC
ncbi:hypothetical protein F2Q70_00013342 [Brassica cretica]|uniref:Uncharacterized protein n=1 Tax=Brassica cretica TaxID=69181 RepID=A0A8S9LST7_BRACR|nr:hypothetical protein F2Q70_00013342 [Brassica cretica]